MGNLVTNIPDSQDEGFQISLDWKSNPATKKLLDVVVAILAEEYIETAKQNPDIFTE